MKKLLNKIKCFRRTGHFVLPESRITSPAIKSMANNEYFVFGSNLDGNHAGGAALYAKKRFGAKQGVAYGRTGKAFAIPTVNHKFGELSADVIESFIDRFIIHAGIFPENRFLVTPIGCGIAGMVPEEIAPLFKKAIKYNNIALPKEFWKVLLN